MVEVISILIGVAIVAIIINRIKDYSKIKKEFRKLASTVSFKQGFDLTGLPIITLIVNGTKMNFVLDTGSTSTVIDSNVIKSNNITYDIVKKTNIIGIEGNSTSINIGTFFATYNNKEYKFQACVKDMGSAFTFLKNTKGVEVSGLLGSDFFETYKYIIDFNEMIAYSKKI